MRVFLPILFSCAAARGIIDVQGGEKPVREQARAEEGARIDHANFFGCINGDQATKEEKLLRNRLVTSSIVHDGSTSIASDGTHRRREVSKELSKVGGFTFCCFAAEAVRRQRALYILLVQQRFVEGSLWLIFGPRPPTAGRLSFLGGGTYCIPGPETSRTCKSGRGELRKKRRGGLSPTGRRAPRGYGNGGAP